MAVFSDIFLPSSVAMLCYVRVSCSSLCHIIHVGVGNHVNGVVVLVRNCNRHRHLLLFFSYNLFSPEHPVRDNIVCYQTLLASLNILKLHSVKIL